jgi:opacity protein-like surface antigen
VNRVPTFLLAFLIFIASQRANAAEYSEVEFPYGRSEITLYAGGFLGDSFIIRPTPLSFEVAAVFDDDVTVGFRYGYYFHPNFAVEGGIGFTPASILTRADVSPGTNASAIFEVNTYVLHANILYRLTADGSIIPYVTAGAGGVHFDIKSARFGFLTPSETDFALNAGGGVKFRLHEEYFLRLDGRVYWMDPEFAKDDGTATFVEITGGLSILFDF